MPVSQRALAVTDAYRAKVRALHARAQAVAHANWQAAMAPDDLNAMSAAFTQRTAPALTVLQSASARLAVAYLAGYTAASTGQRPQITGASAMAPAGLARTGVPLTEALGQPVIAVKAAIGHGHDVSDALKIGAAQAVRNAGEDLMHVARQTLFDGIATSEEIIGWRRVTNGGCGACLALADGTIYSDESALEVHDGCQCTGEPVVRDVPDTVLRPTGEEIFHSWTTEQQDQLLGPDKAHLVRDGDVPFHALVARSPMNAIPDQITEAPLEALHTH